MRVKLNNNGYVKIYKDGRNTATIGGYANDKEVADFLSIGGVVELFETTEETNARETAEANQLIKEELNEFDVASVRDIREWIAAQPSAPQGLKDREATAVLKRGQLQ